MTQIVIALIALLGIVITGVLAIVNTRIQKKMEQIGVQKANNDGLQIQNNIIEQLIPVFEKKDFALDRIADILEQVLLRQELIEMDIRNFTPLLKSRCEAPNLINEIRDLQKVYTKVEDRNSIIKSLIEGEEVTKANMPEEK